MIISAPNKFEGGRTVDALVQLFDLGPTILEWAGAEINETFEAISLNPALYGYAFDGRNFVFCEQAGDVNMTGTSFLTMVRSKTHKLIQFRGEEEGQLFDLESEAERQKTFGMSQMLKI